MTCTAATIAGKPCRRTAIVGAAHCTAHHPDRAAERHRIADLGGAGRRKQLARQHARIADESWFELATVDQLEAAHRHVAQQALRGKIGVRECAAVNAALRGLRAAFDLADEVERQLSSHTLAYPTRRSAGEKDADA